MKKFDDSLMFSVACDLLFVGCFTGLAYVNGAYAGQSVQPEQPVQQTEQKFHFKDEERSLPTPVMLVDVPEQENITVADVPVTLLPVPEQNVYVATPEVKETPEATTTPEVTNKQETPKTEAKPEHKKNPVMIADASEISVKITPSDKPETVKKRKIPSPKITKTDYSNDNLPSIEDVFLSKHGSSLTPYERAALKQAKKWQDNGSSTTFAPIQGQDGAVRFLFGAKQPTIICSVFQVTDLELEAGEKVNSIHLGDSGRWVIDPAVTGVAPTAIQHLIIKPMDVSLNTSLVVTTDRRTYNIRLKSHKRDYMPHVAFIYPNNVIAFANAQQEQAKKEKERLTNDNGEYLGNLDFNYTVKAEKGAQEPVRVYNDGIKTVIQMPKRMKDAPSLVLLDGSDEQIVNYRMQGDRYIVDGVFDKCALISGVGSKQKKVTITFNGSAK